MRIKTPYRYLILFVAAFVLLLAAPVGVDYPIFKHAAIAWMNGSSRLFDAAAPGFFYAPWSLALYAPLAFLPDQIASAVLNALAIIAVVGAIELLLGRGAWWVSVIAIANVWTANHIGSTQFDAYIVFALALAWWALQHESPWMFGVAVVLIGMKPTNALLPLAFLMVLQWRRFTLDQWFTASHLPAITLVGSGLISGLNWLGRYVSFVQTSPPNAGYNMGFVHWDTLTLALMLPSVVLLLFAIVMRIRNAGFDGSVMAAFMFLALLASPYVTIYHYIATVPALVWLGRRDSLYLVLLYAASLLWLMIKPVIPIYPLALSMALAYANRTAPRKLATTG